VDANVVDDVPDGIEVNRLLGRLMLAANRMAFYAWGNKVVRGPFAGMIVPERSIWGDGNASTKLLGVYEHELQPAIEHALWRQPDVVINVGCAEGYYAIGFARMGKRVFGFDVSAEARLQCEDFAEQNDVHVELRDGAYEPEELQLIEVTGKRLYVIDVEGSEDRLIDLKRCSALSSADLIIECHDFLKPGVSYRVANRLSETHNVELIRPRLPDLRFLDSRIPSVMSVLMAVEKRPLPCYWLACWANKQSYPKSGDDHG
jgi:hypothetical protein